MFLPAIVVPFNVLGQVGSEIDHARPWSIDTLIVEEHARALSHDSMMGRGTGTPELGLAASYISDVCTTLNLQPLGSDFLLPVPLGCAQK
jgi:hypothetical protein